jgi:hypothetical protein
MRRAADFCPTYKHKIQKFIHKKIPLYYYLEQDDYLAYLILSYYFDYLLLFKKLASTGDRCFHVRPSIKSPAGIRALPRY